MQFPHVHPTHTFDFDFDFVNPPVTFDNWTDFISHYTYIFVLWGAKRFSTSCYLRLDIGNLTFDGSESAHDCRSGQSTPFSKSRQLDHIGRFFHIFHASRIVRLTLNTPRIAAINRRDQNYLLPGFFAETSSSTPGGKLSTGGIIGTVVAIIGFFWLVALALWWLLRKWRASRTTQTARAGGPDWHRGAHRYEHADADRAPGHRETTSSDALHPALRRDTGYDHPAGAAFGDSDKEAMLLNPSPAPASRLSSPLPDLPVAEGARYGSESPATLVDRPLAPSRPESIKNTELLALAETDYSVAVARARSASVPPPLPSMLMSMSGAYAGFGAELTLARTSTTNPFRARLHAAEVARQKWSQVRGEHDDRDRWAGQRA